MSKVVTPSTVQPTPTMVSRDKVAMRAYDKWCQRGCRHGFDQQDWLEAERELTAECSRTGTTTGGMGGTVTTRR